MACVAVEMIMRVKYYLLIQTTLRLTPSPAQLHLILCIFNVTLKRLPDCVTFYTDDNINYMTCV